MKKIFWFLAIVLLSKTVVAQDTYKLYSPTNTYYWIEHNWDGLGWNLVGKNGHGDEQPNVHLVNINGTAEISNNTKRWNNVPANFGDNSITSLNSVIGMDNSGFVGRASSQQIKSWLGLGSSLFFNADGYTPSKIMVNGVYQGQIPNISLAVGDSDTGFQSTGDGVLLYYRNNEALYFMDEVWHKRNLLPSYEAASGSIVQRDGNGFTKQSYINLTTPIDNQQIANFITDNGDGYMRKNSIDNVKNNLLSNETLQTVANRNNWMEGPNGFKMIFAKPGTKAYDIGIREDAIFTIGDMGERTINVNGQGNVGIGIVNSSEKLTVNGRIKANEIRVNGQGTPDYVFEKGYKIASLEELESYIKKNKHLPEVPSAKEAENNGIELGEMNKILLKKIEELTLHLIAQGKEIQLLKMQQSKSAYKVKKQTKNKKK